MTPLTTAETLAAAITRLADHLAHAEDVRWLPPLTRSKRLDSNERSVGRVPRPTENTALDAARLDVQAAISAASGACAVIAHRAALATDSAPACQPLLRPNSVPAAIQRLDVPVCALLDAMLAPTVPTEDRRALNAAAEALTRIADIHAANLARTLRAWAGLRA